MIKDGVHWWEKMGEYFLVLYDITACELGAGQKGRVISCVV